MGNYYFSIRINIERFPEIINSEDLLYIADSISEILGCNYEELGYVLLDPDYANKNLGKIKKNTAKNREDFKKISIPIRYVGKKSQLSAAPMIHFNLKNKNNLKLSDYMIDIRYPYNNESMLVAVDIKEDICSNREIKIEEFRTIISIIQSKSYVVNTAFLHYSYGNTKRMILDGIQWGGQVSINDWRIIDHSIKYRQYWKDRIMDVFYINFIRKKTISNDTIDRIKKIVGEKNIVEDKEYLTFILPQTKKEYLLNSIITTNKKHLIKQILIKEHICSKDASLLSSILKL